MEMVGRESWAILGNGVGILQRSVVCTVYQCVIRTKNATGKLVSRGTAKLCGTHFSQHAGEASAFVPFRTRFGAWSDVERVKTTNGSRRFGAEKTGGQARRSRRCLNRQSPLRLVFGRHSVKRSGRKRTKTNYRPPFLTAYLGMRFIRCRDVIGSSFWFSDEWNERGRSIKRQGTKSVPCLIVKQIQPENEPQTRLIQTSARQHDEI